MEGDSAPGSTKRWFPLESNPEVMNAYASRLGLDTSSAAFVDVLAVEDWALDMVPRPAAAVLLLFPIKNASEERRLAQQEHIEENGQTVSDKVRFMYQNIDNACGTIAILHALANAAQGPNSDIIRIAPGSYLSTFLSATEGMTAREAADFLCRDDALEECHETAAAEGQSEQVEIDEDVTTHFICFSCVDGHLYELDGRKASPINHGECAPDELLQRAAAVVQSEFMAADPEELRFTLVALAAAAADGDDA